MPVSGLRLFRLFGIEVFLHWSWAVVALIELSARKNHYSSMFWNVAEYLTLFAIVLMHEFGHALACRSVGGRADRIVLWPLGGVAYVAPPPRPGAVLWSIAAGPLVNVALLPLTIGLSWAAVNNAALNPDLRQYLYIINVLNIVLLVFNVLPIYPLDGGQILRALLWFLLGPVTSLMIASVIGMIGSAGLLVLVIALRGFDVYALAMVAFLGWNAYLGYQASHALRAAARRGFEVEARTFAPPPYNPPDPASPRE